ncbi:hypothetical protein OG609_42710 [Streptomyces sp. NBC_01224]|uniref:hypothetical protein n=1 Tax=unclassified Streptomyces TaxID=2593676 RepID=UPI002E12E46B|nr:hypothetical protein OG609_42710 [Streptomyces sp. NBC_01224]
MRFDSHRVVITAVGRDFGRTLAIRLADLDARSSSPHAVSLPLSVRDEIRRYSNRTSRM